jgi:hypothetical protein
MRSRLKRKMIRHHKSRNSEGLNVPLSFERFFGETRHGLDPGDYPGGGRSIRSADASDLRVWIPWQPASNKGISSDSFSDSYGDFGGAVGIELLSDSVAC